MANFHMGRDAVWDVGGQLVCAAELIQTEMQSAVQSANSADWIDASRDQFAAEIAQLEETINQQAEAARVLSQRCESEVHKWEEVCAI